MNSQLPSEEIADRIGRLADTCDNVVQASYLPMPADFHLAQLRIAIREMSKNLKALHVDITGENPWA